MKQPIKASLKLCLIMTRSLIAWMMTPFFALQNNRFDSFTPSDQLKIVNAIASHFGFQQEKLQRWYEKNRHR